MRSHSEIDAPSWRTNWHTLLRAFPGLARAPELQQQGFHERFSKLDQRLVEQAIQKARESKPGNTITVEYLQRGYARLVPRYDAEQPSMAARIVSWWSMDRVARGPFRTRQEAERAGGQVKALWVRPGDTSWFADVDDSEPMPREHQCDALLHVEAMLAQVPEVKEDRWHVPPDDQYERFVSLGRLRLANPPLEPPQPEDDAREDRASTSAASCRSVRRTSSGGGLSTPPVGILRTRNGLRLARHRLPDEVVERLADALDALDDGSPQGAPAPALEGRRGA